MRNVNSVLDLAKMLCTHSLRICLIRYNENMQSILTIQARGYTRKAGYACLDEVLSNCAELYNAALQHRRGAWRQAGESVSYYDQCREITGLRQDDPYWQALSVHVARGVIKRAQRAYDGFFRRVRRGEAHGYPRFKPRSRYRTIEIPELSPSMLKVRGSDLLIKIKGLPTIRIYPNREIPPFEQVKSLQITRRNRALDVSIQFAFTPEALQSTGQLTALDPGVARRLTGSDGFSAERIRRDNSTVEALQREISNFKERAFADGRARWEPVMTRWGTPSCTSRGKPRFRLVWTSGREPLKLRRLMERLTTMRYRDRVRARNLTHEVTSELVQNYDVIGLEDTALTNMTRSAAGSVEEPGKNVAQKSGLNRSVLEQNIGQLRTQLAYKAEWAGRQLVLVDPRNTTKTCSRCCNLNSRPRADRVYRCGMCSLVMDQDENASLNILHATLEAIGVERDRKPMLFEYGIPFVMTKKSRQARSPVVRLRVPPALKTQPLPIG